LMSVFLNLGAALGAIAYENIFKSRKNRHPS
jgi:hypothetical protein